MWCGARNGPVPTSPPPWRARRRCGCASPRAPPPATAAAGSTAGAARASSCRCPGGPLSSRLCPPAAAMRQRGDDVGVAPHVGEVGVGAPGPRGARAPSGGAVALPAAQDRGDLARAMLAPSDVQPATSAASARARAGRGAARGPLARAPSATASAPRHGRSSPPSDSSPNTASRSSASAGTWPPAARMRARDREVEARAGLAQRGRREVDGDPLARELEARVEDRRPDPLAGLAHGAVGESDDGEARQARADVDLDGDLARVEAVDGEGGDAGEHGRPRWPARVTVEARALRGLRAGRRRVRRSGTSRCAESARSGAVMARDRASVAGMSTDARLPRTRRRGARARAPRAPRVRARRAEPPDAYGELDLVVPDGDAWSSSRSRRVARRGERARAPGTRCTRQATPGPRYRGRLPARRRRPPAGGLAAVRRGRGRHRPPWSPRAPRPPRGGVLSARRCYSASCW